MRLRPTRTVRVSAVMCALILAVLNPFPLNPPTGAGEPAVPAAASADVPATGATTIDLLDITDLHGHVSRTTQTGSGAGQISAEDPGVVTLACEVFSVRVANPNMLFVSAGDFVGRSAYVSSIFQDHLTIEALNAISLDASALGNHGLDQGLTDLEVCIPPALNFPILAANVFGSTPLSVGGGGKGIFIKEVGGVRVGFVGIVTDEPPILVSPSAPPTFTLSPAVAVASARAIEFRDGDPANGEVDVAVVLSHEDAASTTTSFSKNVNAVFSGHTRVSFVKTIIDVKGNQIAVVQADHHGWALGRTRLSYDPASRKTLAVSADNKDLRSSSCTTDAYDVAGIASQAEKNSTAEGGEPSAKIGSDFLCGSDGSGFDANRDTESTASNLTAESLRSWLATGIQPTGSARYVGIMNPGGVCADLLCATSGSGGDGVLTSGEAYTVQPFDNEMAYTTLTGAELKTLLSQQWQPGSSRPMLTLELSRNVDVLIEATTDPGYGGEAGAVSTIYEILVDDKPLADGNGVVIASNSLLLTGSDGYTVPKDKPVINAGVLGCDVTSVYLVSFDDKPVITNYFKRQTAMTMGPVYIGSGGVRNTDTVSVTLDSLAYTSPTEQAAGARRVRVSAGDKEILTKDLGLTISPTGLTIGRVDFNLTFPADTLTRACRTIQAATCRWALAKTLDVTGMALNRFSVEIEDKDAVGSGADSGNNAATGADAAADGAGGKAAFTPRSDPGAGEASVGGGTEPSAGSDAQPAATVVPAVSGVPVQAAGPKHPNRAASDSPLALTGASLSAGALVLVLLVIGGYLTLRHKQQVA